MRPRALLGARIGQAGPALAWPQIRLLLESLGQTFASLPQLEGYEDPGWLVGLSFWQVGPTHYGVDVVLYDSQTLSELSGQFLRLGRVVYDTGELLTADDVVLTTLAQAQQAVDTVNEYAASLAALEDAPELPDLFSVFDQVGPDNFAGLLSLLLLGGL